MEPSRLNRLTCCISLRAHMSMNLRTRARIRLRARMSMDLRMRMSLLTPHLMKRLIYPRAMRSRGLWNSYLISR